MLSALIFTPLVIAAIVSLTPARFTPSLRSIMLVVASALFALTLVVAWRFDLSTPGFQCVEQYPWLENLGVSYFVGVDGLSLPLLLLNGLLTLVAIACTPATLDRPRLYYALLFLLNTGVVGAFVAQDLILFFLFYELELIPLYLLIAIWGGARRSYAATKFLLYTAISGVAILASFLGVVWLSDAADFSYVVGLGSSLTLGVQITLLVTLLVGLGIKIPIFPFHTWLPDAHVEASTPVSVLLAGVLLKLGTYGLLRFGVGLFPEAWLMIAPWLATLAAVSALYGAFAAISQQDMKKMIAYSSIAHMGYILLAAAAGTELGLLGAQAQMVAHGLISALLFLLVGIVAKKTGTRDLNVLRGLLNPERGLPTVGSLIILGVMASSGLPGMMGFVAEFIVFRGSFLVFPRQTLACIVGTGLTAVYFLLMINRVFFGRLPDQFSNLPPVKWFETFPAVAIAGLLIFYGIQPDFFLAWSKVQISEIVPSVVLEKVDRDHAVINTIDTAATPSLPATTSKS